MKCDIDRFAYISFIVISVFLSGFIFNHVLAQTENNTTNVKTTFSNVTSNVYETNSNLINSINELDTKIQNLDDSNFVNPTLAKNILHNDLEKVKLAILDGADLEAFNGLINVVEKTQLLMKSSGQDIVIPIVNHVIESMKDTVPTVQKGFHFNLTRSYETHPDVPIRSVYLMRIIPVNELDTKIQNLDDSNFVNPTLAKNILHNDLEKVKLAILDGEQYATYSILVNMTKEIQDPNLVTTTGKGKILPMSDAFIESVKIETTPINPAASAPLENYVYNDTHLESNQSQWRSSYIWIITGLVVAAAAGWTMFAINRNRVIPA